jgi:hypothetical protein
MSESHSSISTGQSCKLLFVGMAASYIAEPHSVSHLFFLPARRDLAFCEEGLFSAPCLPGIDTFCGAILY